MVIEFLPGADGSRSKDSMVQVKELARSAIIQAPGAYVIAFAINRFSMKKRQHAGVAIKPVVGNFAVAEESYQRQFAQSLFHQA